MESNMFIIFLMANTDSHKSLLIPTTIAFIEVFKDIREL